MKLFGLTNVSIEDKSDYRFEELNESKFIKNVIDELRGILQGKFDDFEFFIYSNHRVNKRNPDSGTDIMPPSGDYKSSKKKILLYFSDERGLDPSCFSDKYFAVFKSYIGMKAKAKNVFPLALGYVNAVPEFPNKPINKRKYNVFFRGNLNMNRIDFYRIFSKWGFILPSEKILTHDYYRKFLLKLGSDFSSFFSNSIVIFNNGFKAGFSPEKYGEVLADSKIVLCPKGYFMTECFRHFEAMRAGCVIISEPLPDTPFYANSPLIQVNNWEKGCDIAQELLKDEAKLEEIHRKTLAWWEEKCSEHATAQYIVAKIEELERI
ncbi:glycosyltransferase family 47 protein [Cyclobacterium amurskyense]|jgi:hypothetical protein|uniref:Exostosin GT47 domain-containing protein n=1 Tax=Cyclobacterium amurskyense TaxID=320787 RepID=A0A0H4P6P3_9BACT|nr:hypothetical protein [Cyclobacterium amurskyense]AKP50111.1 hypothetical protein CA2015_0647 [Cyclobacterium amurskyense]|tara:strand:- start:1371 stop:2333 length:963 start_codon:yes stop_codon:yes gene_type:complete